MPVLKDARQEKFCQLWVRGGMKQQDAHHEAGYAFNPGNASKLAAKPAVRARIQELKEEAARKAVENAAIDRTWVMIRLMRVAERCLGDDIEHADEFQPSSACRSLELLGKELGMFKDQHVLTGDEDAPIEVIRRVIVDARGNGHDTAAEDEGTGAGNGAADTRH